MDDTQTSKPSATLTIGSGTRRIFMSSVIIVVGIVYNLFHDRGGLIDAFRFNVFPAWTAMDLIGGAVVLAVFLGYKSIRIMRAPLAATADETGVALRGDRKFTWDQVEKIWLGAPYGKESLRGNCLLLDTRGILRKRVRVWLPFVFGDQKQKFMAVAAFYKPKAVPASQKNL